MLLCNSAIVCSLQPAVNNFSLLSTRYFSAHEVFACSLLPAGRRWVREKPPARAICLSRTGLLSIFNKVVHNQESFYHEVSGNS